MMTDTELDRLLETIGEIVSMCPTRLDDVPLQPAQPTNDNSPEWPMIPFPKGWQASC